ncbi:MAG: winged helix-turn-helix domain-containing protein [Gammaproteobacteria bacterium]|nr:winged helix-turn-helix domain-containing protein [Gammaproteobacteria bacterium]
MLIDDETLRSYVDKYQQGGIEELLQTNYSGRQVNLDDKQLKFLRLELDDNIYLTAGAIIEFVFDNFNVSYSVSGMRDLLHREGYTYKKPKLVPGNPDREAQEDFVQYYEEFMEVKDS